MMSEPKAKFLSCRHLPGRLTAIETAWYLGFSENDIPVLASRKLLKPVGDPSQSATKYYALKDLKKVHEDVRWINRASATLNKYWQLKNAKKTNQL
jgi:hypothetical protein